MPRVPTVFAFPGIALDHLVASLEARESHIRDRVLLMVSLLGGNDRSKGGKREVDTWEGHQVRLELVEIDVQRTVEPQRRRDGGDDLSDEAVEVGEAWLSNAQLLLADVEDGFVVNLNKDQEKIGGDRRDFGHIP